MKITLLGTGTSQGVPVIACECSVCMSKNFKDKRLRSSAMIEVDDTTIIIDTGPDFRQQMLRENVKKVDAILFTHHHKDHTSGIEGIKKQFPEINIHSPSSHIKNTRFVLRNNDEIETQINS